MPLSGVGLFTGQQQPPEVQKGPFDVALGAAGAVTKGAFNTVLEVLNTPGNIVRGTLVGEFGVFKDLIPFNDVIGGPLAAPKISGRELLERHGILGKNTAGFDLGDVAGFMAEVGTDPLVFTSVGGLTKAGRAANDLKFVSNQLKATRVFARNATGDKKKYLEELSEQLAKRARGLVEQGAHVKNARQRAPLRLRGTEMTAGPLFKGVPEPIGRVARSLPGAGAVSKIGSEIADKLRFAPKDVKLQRLYDTAKQVERRATITAEENLVKLHDQFKHVPPAELTEYLERLVPDLDSGLATIRQQMDTVFGETDVLTGALPSLKVLERESPKLAQFLKRQGKIQKEYAALVAASKRPGFLPKQHLKKQAEKILTDIGIARKVMEEEAAAKFGEDFVEGLGILRRTYQDMLQQNIDSGFMSFQLDDVFQAYHYHLVTPDGAKWLHDNPSIRTAYHSRIKNNSLDLVRARKKKGKSVKDINEWAKSVGYAGKSDFMESNMFAAAAKRFEQMAASQMQGDYYRAVYETFALSPLELKAVGKKNTRSLVDHFLDNGVTSYRGVSWKLSDRTLKEGEKAVEWISPDSAVGQRFKAAGGKVGSRKEAKTALRRFFKENFGTDDVRIETKVWDDAQAPWKSVDEFRNNYKFITSVYDGVSSMYRGLTTTIFPAYFARNIMGNIWNSAVIGPMNKSTAFSSYAKAWRIEGRMARGETLTAAERKLLENAQVDGILRRNTFEDTAKVYQLEGDFGFTGFSDPVAWLRERVNSKSPWSKVLEPARPAIEAGYQATRKARGIPLGYRAGVFYENNARFGMYLDLLQQGKSRAEATAAVRKYLFNYDELSGFEKTYLRRLAFFYTFTRKNVPLMLEHIAQPTSRMWAALAGRGDEPGELMPDWVRESGRFVLQTATETEPFYKTLDMGLPITEFAQAKIMSRLNPVLQVPMQLATGTDFFLGRNLSELNRAGLVSRTLDQLVGGEDSTFREVTGFRKKTTATGKTRYTIHPFLSNMARLGPAARLFSVGADPQDTGLSAYVNLIGGIKLQERELSPRSIRFNKVADAFSTLTHQGRLYEGTFVGASDKTDIAAQKISRFLNQR